MKQEQPRAHIQEDYYIYFNGHGTNALRQRISHLEVEEAKTLYPKATVLKMRTTTTTFVEYETL